MGTYLETLEILISSRITHLHSSQSVSHFSAMFKLYSWLPPKFSIVSVSASENVNFFSCSLFQANILHLFSWFYIPNAVWWEEVSLPSYAAEIPLLWRPQCSFWVRIKLLHWEAFLGVWSSLCALAAYNLLSHLPCDSEIHRDPLIVPFHILGTSPIFLHLPWRCGIQPFLEVFARVSTFLHLVSSAWYILF